MKIRKAGLNDIEKLREIGTLTFAKSFAAENTEENMAEYLEKGFQPKN